MSQVKHNVIRFVALFAMAPLAPGAELSLPSPAAGAGSSVSISIAFTPGPKALSGVQFDLQYDSSAVNVVVTPGDSAGSPDKNIYVNDLSPNDRRFLVVGLNQNAIPGGNLLTLFLNLSPNAPSGAYPLVISNPTGTDAMGNASPLTGVNGSLIIDGSSGSRIQASGILNAASLVSGPVAPGEIVTLIGSGIGPSIATQPASSVSSTALGSTSVTIGGNPAPLLYAGPNQINAIIPYEVSGQSTAQMFLMNNGQLVAGFPLPVAAANPAIFTLDSSGVGPGAILNQDSSVNSPLNPAVRGSVVVLFATGAGAMNSTPVDGQITGNIPPLTSLPVSVQIGGTAAQVQYAGAAPGLVAGVLQVNCTVPQNIAPGESVPVELTVGPASSPAGVTIAVQ